MNWLLPLAALGALAACAVERPLDMDLVKDGASAIHKYKKECVADWNTRELNSSGWRAELKDRKWHVFLGRGFCPISEGYVAAADGKTDCMVCVS